MVDNERDEQELDLTSPQVVTKYKDVAGILNKALRFVLSECKPKAKIVDICEKGDAFIREQTRNMYEKAKKKIEKGVAFPTCISVNNCVCHFSPLAGDETSLKEGDVLKIDLGCHIDGFIAVVGHTQVLLEGSITGNVADVIVAANTAAQVALRLVRPGKKKKDVTEAIQKVDLGCHIDGFIAVVGHTHVLLEGSITGNVADVIVAANTAAQVALRLVRPGKKKKDDTKAIQKVVAAYDCKIVEGVLIHQMKRFIIDGKKAVSSVSNSETQVDDAEFKENEVYCIDIVTSNGEGKPELLDEKQTTIYQRAADINSHLRAVDINSHLKTEASRIIFSEINQKFPIMPFTARALEDERDRLGLVEYVNHGLLQPYPVLHEKPGDLVAHVKLTVLLMPNGSDLITSHPLQEMQPTRSIDDPEIKGWLALGTRKKKKKGDNAVEADMDSSQPVKITVESSGSGLVSSHKEPLPEGEPLITQSMIVKAERLTTDLLQMNEPSMRLSALNRYKVHMQKSNLELSQAIEENNRLLKVGTDIDSKKKMLMTELAEERRKSKDLDMQIAKVEEHLRQQE